MASAGGSLMDVLCEVYECSVNATRPSRTPAEVARAIVSGVRAHETAGPHGNETDASCLALTLIGRMVARATAPAAHGRVAGFYRDAVEVLLQDLDVVSQMVAKFGCEEQMVSHLAAKSASACVLYRLQVSGVVSPAWHQTCQRALLSSPAGPELDSVLWSLTRVLQKLLQDNRQEPVRMLLMAFDTSVSASTSRFLPADRSPLGAPDTSCLLLDLLELLTASGSAAPAGTRGPKLTYIHAAALIAAVSRAPHYFVSKRAALLLKRAALRKAGEDWLGASGENAASDASDIGVLAAAVSDALAAGWLTSVRVESARFFGGTSAARGGPGDSVMLRALGLLVIKSVQHRVVSAAAGAAEAGGHLGSLWRFLRQKGVRPTDTDHDCGVLPLLFSEQDDDMMEAAKAALVIFLHLRDDWRQDDSAPVRASCVAGCNPHCHFLFLLGAVSADHRILLDFLISTETCFLDYLVRYLRYLRTDRRGFAASCRRLDAGGRSLAPSGGCRLVDYDDSDEEASGDSPGSERLRSNAGASDDTLGRALGCLVRLRRMLARLQNKNLFPYKADSLLKLLTQVIQLLNAD
ncbi:protein Lines homolog 1 isoform X1 [Phyllopteryx taeniolatus]|uniref:protein Lines homolog 1 isoform X1 n=1 Tax=Phyllopteryx taeniolatus TaxID=161469 RepID=UPI002AD51B68|nr:protein Lines homolog 1 isoform X1 [Phyllopteryx taeniolatus]